ncbi:MAG: esterase [Devosia sp.]|nr:esterase [Devosia sp.]
MRREHGFVDLGTPDQPGYGGGGREADDPVVVLILDALPAGVAGQLLPSHDLGRHEAGQPGRGVRRRYMVLIKPALRLLRGAGVDAAMISGLAKLNQLEALVRRGADDSLRDWIFAPALPRQRGGCVSSAPGAVRRRGRIRRCR